MKLNASAGRFDAYPQSMFFSRNKKNNIYPCKPQFYHIKVGIKEACFRDETRFSLNVRKRTFGHVRPAKIQISLHIRAI